MKIKAETGGAAAWLRENRLSCIVLLCAALLFVLLRIWAAPEPEEGTCLALTKMRTHFVLREKD